MTVLAGGCLLPSEAVAVYSSKRDAEQAGVTNVGYSIALNRLLKKKFIELEDIYDEHDGEKYQGTYITESGWNWIEANDSKFVLHRAKKTDLNDNFSLL